MEPLKTKIAKRGLLGGIFLSLGGLGAFGVCHTICQGLVIVLAAIGITFIGMPLAFLQEPWFTVFSFFTGGIFILLAIFAYLKHKKMKQGR